MSGRSERFLIHGREQSNAEVAAIFASSADVYLQTLADRMMRCQQARVARSQWHDLRDAASYGWAYHCKTIACASCRRAHAREWQNRVYSRFADADNENCSHATIHLARVGDLTAMRGVATTARRAVRDIRDRHARQASWWRSVEIAGMIEVDAMDVADIPLLLKNRAQLLPQLPLYGTNSWMWLPHAHLVIRHDAVTRAELCEALMAHWSEPHQVDVQAFHHDNLANTNAANVNGYACKFDMRTNVQGAEEPWPAGRRAEWLGWLCSLRRGLEPLRVSVNPMSGLSTDLNQFWSCGPAVTNLTSNTDSTHKSWHYRTESDKRCRNQK